MIIEIQPKQIEFLELVLYLYHNKGHRTLKDKTNDKKMKNSILKALKNEAVYVRPVSKFQKDDCLFCSELATAEAIYKSSQIRCCVKCIGKAKILAKKLAIRWIKTN